MPAFLQLQRLSLAPRQPLLQQIPAIIRFIYWLAAASKSKRFTCYVASCNHLLAVSFRKFLGAPKDDIYIYIFTSDLMIYGKIVIQEMHLQEMVHWDSQAFLATHQDLQSAPVDIYQGQGIKWYLATFALCNMPRGSARARSRSPRRESKLIHLIQLGAPKVMISVSYANSNIEMSI